MLIIYESNLKLFTDIFEVNNLYQIRISEQKNYFLTKCFTAPLRRTVIKIIMPPT